MKRLSLRIWPIGLVLAACLAMAGPTLAMTLALAGRDNGRTLPLRAGDLVHVTLAENDTTPCHWVFVTRPATSVLRYMGSQYKPSPAAPGQVGVGGHRTFNFKSVHRGVTSVKLGVRCIGSKQTTNHFTLRVSPG